jgi:multiple sugar transport system ATP-binding protein
MGLSDKVAVMYGGVIEQYGPPVEVYSHPATRFVGGFMGNPPMNFVTLPIRSGEVILGGARLVPPVAGGSEVVLGLRGETVRLAGQGAGIPFAVRVVEPMGSHLLLTGSIAGQPVRVTLPPGETVRPGETVDLAVDPAQLTWLSAETGRALAA